MAAFTLLNGPRRKIPPLGYLSVSVAGRYAIKIRYAAAKEWKDGEYIFTVGSPPLKGPLNPPATGINTKPLTLAPLRFQKQDNISWK